MATTQIPNPRDMRYSDYVASSIELGLAQVARGESISHDEVEKTLRQRWRSTNTNAR